MTELPVANRVVWTASFLLAGVTHIALVLPWLWHEPDALAPEAAQEFGDLVSGCRAAAGAFVGNCMGHFDRSHVGRGSNENPTLRIVCLSRRNR
jgi:hypothetical protein